MNQSTKYIVGVIIVVAVITVGYLLSKNPSDVSAESIKIGVIAPMTGNNAFLGEGIRDAYLTSQRKLGEHELQV